MLIVHLLLTSLLLEPVLIFLIPLSPIHLPSPFLLLLLSFPLPLLLLFPPLPEKEGVFVFLKLLLAMLSNNLNNQNRLFHSEGLATIAALLMKTTPTLITVSAFQTIQELVELFNQEEHTRAEVYKHLIFDFRIWSRPTYSVRIGECLPHHLATM